MQKKNSSPLPAPDFTLDEQRDELFCSFFFFLSVSIETRLSKSKLSTTRGSKKSTQKPNASSLMNIFLANPAAHRSRLILSSSSKLTINRFNSTPPLPYRSNLLSEQLSIRYGVFKEINRDQAKSHRINHTRQQLERTILRQSPRPRSRGKPRRNPSRSFGFTAADSAR